MGAWEWQITDRFGTALGELQQAPQVTLQKPIKRVATGQVTVFNDNPRINDLRRMDQTMIKGYRNGILVVHGPFVPSYSKNVSGDNRTAVFNYCGQGWRIGRRLIPATKVAAGFTYGSALAPLDRGTIWSTILNDVNAVNDTGLRFDPAVDYSPTSATNLGPYYYKNALQALGEMFAPQDAGEWIIVPTEPTPDATGLCFGRFKIQPVIGTARTDVVFEYGDGKRNVASFTENTDFGNAMNTGYSLPSGFPDNATQQVLSYSDPNSIANRGYWYEDVLTDSIVTDDMRQKLLQQNVTIRSTPTTVIRFVPTVDPRTGVMPQYGVDFVEGDVVQFRAVEYGEETVNGWFRIYEVDFATDVNGNETVTPVLVSTDEQGLTV